MIDYRLSNLDQLEAEAMYVIREAAAQFERPVLLFSGGKDSLVMLHAARKAFAPARLPFPILHIDTGHNFPETIAFRDELVEKLGLELIVRYVEDSIKAGRVQEETGPNASRNALQSVTLVDALEEMKFDAALGGGRRDEEKARAKERFFSHRDAFGQWDPKNQRPELWNLYFGRKAPGEHFRVFPISNWTELDVWEYIKREALPIPDLYYAHERDVVERDGNLLALTPFITVRDNEQPKRELVRFRTIGDATCTGAVRSDARNIEGVLAEVAATRVTERGTRSDDKRSDSAMEDRKKQGYF